MDQDAILRKLAGGGVIRRHADGRYVLGRKALPQAMAAGLLRDGLLRPLAEGRYDLSALGRARAGQAARRGGGALMGAPMRGEDRQDAFRAQHQMRSEIVEPTVDAVDQRINGRAAVTVNRTESPLGWLRCHRNAQGKYYLDDAQCEAGERLRRDFELAGLGPRVTAAWTGLPVARGRRSAPEIDPTERQVAARQRLRQALDALGSELSDVTLRVCCFLEGLETIEQRQGWPVRSGKVVLGIALTRLVRHYGLTPGHQKEPNRLQLI